MVNYDEMIQMALDAGFERNSLGWTFTYGKLDYHLERFANLVAAAEREACAKVCEDIDAEYEGEDVLATWCANAIRARGQQK